MDPSGRPMMLMYQPQVMPYGPFSSAEFGSLDYQLRAQVEFYFSDSNLAADRYLQEQMDGEGFVLLTVLLEFKRLQTLLDAAQPGPDTRSPRAEGQRLELLRIALGQSQLLEMDASKVRVRRRGDWAAFLPSTLNNNEAMAAS